MKALIALLLLSPYAAAQSKDPCGSEASILECPEKYIPKGRKPSTSERAVVEGLILEADELVGPLESAKLKLEGMRTTAQQARTERTIGYVYDKEQIAFQEYAEAAEAYRRLKKAYYEAHNRAIAAAVDTYGLRPPVESFADDERLGPQHRRVPAWNPKFSELEINAGGKMGPRTAKEIGAAREKASSILGRSVSATGARTFPDGRVVVYRLGFESRDISSADNLAMLIYHETVHWVERIRRGRDTHGPSEHFRSEQLAYSRDAGFIQRLDLPSESREAIASQYGKQADLARGKDWSWVQAFHSEDWIDASYEGSPAMSSFMGDPGALEAYRIEADAAFDREMGLDKEAQAVPIAPVGTRATEIAPAQIPTDVLETLDSIRQHYHAMQAIVANACEKPESLTSYYVSEFGIAYMNASMAFDVARARTKLKLPLSEQDLYDGLQGCQFDLMKAFLEKPLWFPGQSGDSGWALGLAQAYDRARHPTQDTSPTPRPRDAEPSGRSITLKYGPAYRQAEGMKRP